ncbi:MAG: ERCC4 domain-containing protein [Roseiflexaceae bacterium]
MAVKDVASLGQPLRIHVDSRERQSPIPALLASFPDVVLSFAALPSADYLLSDTVAVERKTASDFVASILDRRLFGQTTRMSALFPRALLIIEGGLAQVPHRIDMQAIRGALAFLAVRAGITVLQLSDATETAAMLRLMARHAQERMDQPVSLREPRPPIEELYGAYLVEGLPGIGPRRARLLLAHFGSPAAVMCATAEELVQVPGIGKKSAQRIWQTLNTHYPPDMGAGELGNS